MENPKYLPKETYGKCRLIATIDTIEFWRTQIYPSGAITLSHKYYDDPRDIRWNNSYSEKYLKYIKINSYDSNLKDAHKAAWIYHKKVIATDRCPCKC